MSMNLPLYFLLSQENIWLPTRHVARNFDGGGNNNQASTFEYLMPLVFKALSVKGVFFWCFFLNNCVQI